MVIDHGIERYKQHQTKTNPSSGTPTWWAHTNVIDKWGYFTPIIQVTLAKIPYRFPILECPRKLVYFNEVNWDARLELIRIQ